MRVLVVGLNETLVALHFRLFWASFKEGGIVDDGQVVAGAADERVLHMFAQFGQVLV